ncbi:hypothetical protein [Pseudovibrio ascidiaceicola]|uniref:hypothetical protein n=1 Tax=Pseudovibrio ascidiaceicola TaxID=285279 RepID=UPI001113A3C9|nr:hypothetical protein [Pseudovibrio ascidiaceicola]
MERLIGLCVDEIRDAAEAWPADWESFLEDLSPAANAYAADDPEAEWFLSRDIVRGAGRKEKFCPPELAWKAIKLLAIIHEHSQEGDRDIAAELSHFNPDAFRSLLSETSFLDRNLNAPSADIIANIIEERVIRRHMWVALRKFRYQRDYTFLIEMDEGRIRLREKDGPLFTNPRLRGAGCRNNIVIPDSRMLTHALTGASTLPDHAGKLYTVKGATARQVFHPKLFLQIGRKGGRIIVGSANITSSGLAGNLELVDTISCGEEDSADQRMVAAAWQYLARFVGHDQEALRGQQDWMLARAPWLRQAVASTEKMGLADQTEAALLTTGIETGIGQRFAGLIDEPVTRLIVVSPYWDMGLTALSYLNGRLSPEEVSVVIDPVVVQFPKDAVSALSNMKLYRRNRYREGRFIHAKTIIAQTQNADHVLLGSANCTLAALGRGDYVGKNEEVCLYRRLPPDTIIHALELADVLDEEQTIEPAEIDEPELDDDLPLEELAEKAPGQFEVRVDVLVWRPTSLIDPAACTIELLDQNGSVIPCAWSPLHSEHSLRFQISGTDVRPSFACLVFTDGHRSAPAIVTLIGRLSAAIREARSRKTENALRGLDEETEAGLMLMEVLDFLEQLEPDADKDKAPISIPKAGHGDNDASAAHYEVLSYEQFIARRRPRTAQANLTHNSLAGSEVTLVRGFLNRILGIDGQRDEIDESDNDYLMSDAFNLDDETDNAEAAIAAGVDFGKEEKTLEEEEREEAARKCKAAQRKATKDQLVSAALKLGQRIMDRQETGQLDNHDILRLRALLMIIAAASWKGSEANKGNQPPRSSIQVLPAEGDKDSWPFVMGRLIFVVFGGKDPAIRQLYLSNEHDQIPDDIVECWATCYWCFQACMQASISEIEKTRITKHLGPIASYAYTMTLPTKAELLSDNITTILDSMNARYAEKLGIEPDAIENGHRSFVEDLFALGQAATQSTS